MKTLLAICGMIFILSSLASGQDRVNYTVRYRPLAILDKPDGNILTSVPKNKTVSLSSYNKQCDCFRAKYLEFEGILQSELWLNDVFSKSKKKNYELSDSVKRLLTQYKLANDRESDGVFTVEKNSELNQGDINRTMDLIDKWGYTNGKRIAENKIWVGMTVEMTLESWGIPYRVNRSKVSGGIREQWIYSEAYLYFENGTLAEIFKLNQPQH